MWAAVLKLLHAHWDHPKNMKLEIEHSTDVDITIYKYHLSDQCVPLPRPYKKNVATPLP